MADRRFLVSGSYCTWSGNLASFCREIVASDPRHAMDIMRERVHGWKRYSGKLDMSAIALGGEG